MVVSIKICTTISHLSFFIPNFAKTTLSTYTLQRPSQTPPSPPPAARLLVNVYKQGTTNLIVRYSQNVSAEGKDKWEELNIGLTTKQAVDIEVICENTSTTPVFFDEISVKVQSVPTTILVQENHYYPFGLGMRGLDWVLSNGKEDRFAYNGKEKQTDFDLNWSDYGARQYDPQCGCFRSVDPLAEKMASWSPYNYVFNNPIRLIDPDGKAPCKTENCSDSDPIKEATDAIAATVSDIFVGIYNLAVGRFNGKQASNDKDGISIQIGKREAPKTLREAITGPLVDGLSASSFLPVSKSALLYAKTGLETGVKTTITSVVKQDKRLLKEAKSLEKTEFSDQINSLMSQMQKGNIKNAGRGTHDVEGVKGVYEMRHKEGARLYFRQTGENSYEIVGYSNKANQDRVINILQELYGKK